MPGGRIELGETIKEGVLRELYEECGIGIKTDQSGSCSYMGKKIEIEPYFGFESSSKPLYQ